MCQPDLTIEVKDARGGGVSGFGTQHRCKDWESVMNWVTRCQLGGWKRNGSYIGAMNMSLTRNMRIRPWLVREINNSTSLDANDFFLVYVGITLSLIVTWMKH
jgi:hypothetical protein